jgi:hypothetical protein
LLLILDRAVNLKVRVPRKSWHFTVSDPRLPQPGGPGSRIYNSQEQGGLVITPGIGFPLTEHGRSSHIASEPTYRKTTCSTSSTVVWRHGARVSCARFIATDLYATILSIVIYTLKSGQIHPSATLATFLPNMHVNVIIYLSSRSSKYICISQLVSWQK